MCYETLFFLLMTLKSDLVPGYIEGQKTRDDRRGESIEDEGVKKRSNWSLSSFLFKKFFLKIGYCKWKSNLAFIGKTGNWNMTFTKNKPYKWNMTFTNKHTNGSWLLLINRRMELGFLWQHTNGTAHGFHRETDTFNMVFIEKQTNLTWFS